MQNPLKGWFVWAAYWKWSHNPQTWWVGRTQWHNHWGSRGAECPLDSEEFAKNREKEGENQEKEGKNREKGGKIGKVLSLCPSWQIRLATLLVQRCHFSDYNMKSDFLCPDFSTFIDFQPVLDHFAHILCIFSDFLAKLSGISARGARSYIFWVVFWELLKYWSFQSLQVSLFFSVVTGHTWPKLIGGWGLVHLRF